MRLLELSGIIDEGYRYSFVSFILPTINPPLTLAAGGTSHFSLAY